MPLNRQNGHFFPGKLYQGIVDMHENIIAFLTYINVVRMKKVGFIPVISKE